MQRFPWAALAFLCLNFSAFSQPVPQNQPYDLSQSGPNNQPLPWGSRFAVPASTEVVKLQAMLGAPVRCSEVLFEYEVSENGAPFTGKPTVAGQPKQICFGGSGSLCTGNYKDSTPFEVKPDRYYDWSVRTTSKIYHQGNTCGALVATATSKWVTAGAIYAFSTAPNWYMTSSSLGEASTYCGIEAYDQDPTYFTYPPDQKFAGYKTTGAPGCQYKFDLRWSALLTSRFGSKDGFFFANFKSDRACQGKLTTSEDTAPEKEFVLGTFNLQPNVPKTVQIRIGHSPDPMKSLDFVSYVRNSTPKGTVPIKFECVSNGDFQVFFDTIAVLYQTQDYLAFPKIDEAQFAKGYSGAN